MDCLASTLQATALMFAGSNSHTNICELLILNGACVDSLNCYGNSTLHEAVRLGVVDLVKLLIKHKANVNVTNKKGRQVL